jgi:Domain of unknown function (DUF5911)
LWGLSADSRSRNGRTAALVDPLSRIVWWCYPRFDGDPIFFRLLAGGEAKGFCDVLLEGMVDFVRTVEAIEREFLRDSMLCVMRARMISASRKRFFSYAGSG